MKTQRQSPHPILFSILGLWMLLSCQSVDRQEGVDVQPTQPVLWNDTEAKDPSKFYFSYHLDAVVKENKLPRELTEISGLCMSSDGEYLLAVNDEQGTIFFLNKRNGKIVREKKFGSKGDYEGIVMADNQVYVLRSDGTIYEVSNLDARELETRTYSTTLDDVHNVEGLAYDPSNNRLLLACKKNTFEGKSTKDLKAIYSFDLATMGFSETPVYLISRKEPIFGKEARMENWWPDALSKSFGPSGLTVDPESGNIYLLSSPGKLLLVLNPSGEIIHVQKLDKKVFRQPEGICLGQDRTLFISSEGNAKKGVRGEVLSFHPL